MPHPSSPLRGEGTNLLLFIARCDRPAMRRARRPWSYITFLLN